MLINEDANRRFPLLLFGNFEPQFMIGVLIAVLVGMTVHEFAHNYVAHLMGDPNPSREGRLTLDPSVHIYWPGFIMFVLLGFGILGTAPIAAHRMRNPRWGYLAAVAAGPFSNLLIAVIFGLSWTLLGNPPIYSEAYGQFLYLTAPTFIDDLLFAIVFFNILLFIFNLLPLFPLDGWHIVLSILPVDLAYTWRAHAQNTQFAFMFIILLSFAPLGNFDPLGTLINEPMLFITRLIIG